MQMIGLLRVRQPYRHIREYQNSSPKFGSFKVVMGRMLMFIWNFASRGDCKNYEEV